MRAAVCLGAVAALALATGEVARGEDRTESLARVGAAPEHGALEEQVAKLTVLIERIPNSVDAHVRRGEALLALHEAERAAVDAERATGLDPKHARAWKLRGNVYYELRKYAAAITAYSAAIERDPNAGLAYAGRGGARTYEGDPEGALADFNAALAKGFATAWAYNGRGNAYRVLGETKRALADYVRAVELDPHEVDAFLNLGDLHSLAGRYEVAVVAYGLALDFHPEDPADAVAAHARRGGVLAKLGRPEEALADFEQSFLIGGAWQIAGVQRELAAAGLYAGAITGTYDRATARALRRCLADRGC